MLNFQQILEKFKNAELMLLSELSKCDSYEKYDSCQKITFVKKCDG